MEYSDINHSNIFLDLSPKAKEIKSEINKRDTLKLKSFCTAKETSTKQKDNLLNRGKHLQIIMGWPVSPFGFYKMLQKNLNRLIGQSNLTHEVLIYKTYKQLMKVYIKNQTSQTSLAVQWLRPHASTAGDTGSTPGWGTRIPKAAWHGQNNKEPQNNPYLK